MTIAERNIQREVRDNAKKLRDEGKQVKIGYKKLTVDGTVWRWDRKEKALKKLKNKESKNGTK